MASPNPRVGGVYLPPNNHAGGVYLARYNPVGGLYLVPNNRLVPMTGLSPMTGPQDHRFLGKPSGGDPGRNRPADV